MENKTITFFVRAKDDTSSVVRSLCSIRRQGFQNYKVIVVSYREELSEKISNLYPDFKVFTEEGDKGFCMRFNTEIQNVDSDYCVIVNGDSVLTQHAAKAILLHDEDSVLFNLSRTGTAFKFEPIYGESDFKNPGTYFKKMPYLWGIAFKPSLIRKKKITLTGIGYPDQMLFVHQCVSASKKVGMHKGILLYKRWLQLEHEVTFAYFFHNRKTILRVIKNYKSKHRNLERSAFVERFVFPCLENYYTETRPLNKFAKLILVKRYLGI